jgi:hypothetical protein
MIVHQDIAPQAHLKALAAVCQQLQEAEPVSRLAIDLAPFVAPRQVRW